LHFDRIRSTGLLALADASVLDVVNVEVGGTHQSQEHVAEKTNEVKLIQECLLRAYENS
jgi:hypothetical protein